MSDNNNNDNRLLRIGILGCASIAKKNVIAILNEASGCVVTAVASRSAEKVQTFANDFLAPRLIGTQSGSMTPTFLGGSTAYDDLLQSDTVDAIYIPLPTTRHKEWVIKALTAGKHVLLEKPVAVSAKEYEKMLAVAHQHHKFLMDGTMFVHHPRIHGFVQAVQKPSTMGSLRRIEASFSFCGDDAFLHQNIRVQKDADPLGCVGDLGWYVVRLALLVLLLDDKTCPEATVVQVTDFELNEEGVPVDVTCLVKFPNKVVLSFHVSFQEAFRQYVHVVGTQGWASMNDFVLPKQKPLQYQVHSMSLTDYDLITEHDCHVETLNDDDGPVQEVLMWNTFARLAKAIDDDGTLAGEGSWNTSDTAACREAQKLSEISLLNQRILDAIMLSIQKDGAKVELRGSKGAVSEPSQSIA